MTKYKKCDKRPEMWQKTWNVSKDLKCDKRPEMGSILLTAFRFLMFYAFFQRTFFQKIRKNNRFSRKDHLKRHSTLKLFRFYSTQKKLCWRNFSFPYIFHVIRVFHDCSYSWYKHKFLDIYIMVLYITST